MNHEKRIKDVTVRSVLSSNVYKMIGFRMSSSENGLVSVVEIQHGKVKCPCGCEETFSVKRSAHGAQKADLQSFLDDDQRKIAAWSKGNLAADKGYTKEQLRGLMINAGVIINPNPFNSAVSCLLRLGFFSDKREGHDVFYQFSQERFIEYLRKGGILK